MSVKILLNSECLHNLELSPVTEKLEKWQVDGNLTDYEQQISFNIEYPREENDPRELSEISEVRLWFIRLDACYPWFLYLLDGKSGESYRYIAMLVPHQFSRSEGIQYNPEALEIFVMNKMFVLGNWLKQQGVSTPTKLKAIAQTLGYELEDDFFAMLGL
ncbi:MAG: CRR6 family NdhI maturation factor [Cyanobacteriota bacterium]|nr:CRR6 family NdhI maturation factor [Cyanobacteriota bacterium]